jgi:ABC-2 type transport system ATP-binding protein
MGVNPIISVRDLTKTFQTARRVTGSFSSLRSLFSRQYQTVRAVDGIHFEIGRGEIVGYLGPNGAGKSTTLKMLSGLLVPTSGTALVDGYVPWKERQTYVRRLGAVFGQRTTLWWDLPVIESLEMLAHIYRIPAARFQNNLYEFRKLLELDPFLNTPVRSLSLGQRMRADLCAALLHNPDLLFLDEPTIGLDVVAKERIRQFILHINRERGVTILLTTHDLSDVEKLCERVMIIDRGRLLYDGSLAALRERFSGKRRLVVDFDSDYALPSVEGAEIAGQGGRRVTYLIERGCNPADLISRLAATYRIRDLEVHEARIEETVRKIYEEKLLE